MLSLRAQKKVESTIPALLKQYAGTLAPSDKDRIDLSTAENWLVRPELLHAITAPRALHGFAEEVSG